MGGENPAKQPRTRRPWDRWRVPVAILVVLLIFAALFEFTRHNGYHFGSSSPPTDGSKAPAESQAPAPSSSFPSAPLPTSSPASAVAATPTDRFGFPVDDKQLIDSYCKLPPVTEEPKDGLTNANQLVADMKGRQVGRLAKAVSIATENFDNMGDVDKDPRWKKFDEFHEALRVMFPFVHSNTTLEKINKYGLLYTWQGANEKLKPIMFTAHQDVVPAGPASKWENPPFKGFYDDKYLWGRGSSDCKNNLIGLLSTVEALLSQGFEPTRTVLLAFGFDEETGGERGAKKIGEHLEQKYGKNSLAMIHDEGGMGIDVVASSLYAAPAVQEKGFVNVNMHIEMKGGHSSEPPPHTAIGIMSELIYLLEQRPLAPQMVKENAYMNMLQCYVRHDRAEVENFLPSSLAGHENATEFGAHLVRRGSLKFDNTGKDIQYLIQTSQAADIFRGGKKDNKLPEFANATINYRIAPQESIADIKKHVTDTIHTAVSGHGLAVVGFGFNEPLHNYPHGKLVLTTSGDLEPSRISPMDEKNGVWQLFAGTIRQVFQTIGIMVEDPFAKKTRTVIPQGSIMKGNTDTQHYTSLTENIYRFTPARTGLRLNAHAVDERIDMDAHLEGMMLYYDLIRNFQAADDTALGL